MKKFALVTLSALIASASIASAQSFDVSSMPLGQFPSATDNTATGSIGAQLKKRVVERDGVAVTQFYKLDAKGNAVVISEDTN
jgi:hypothetical protein